MFGMKKLQADATRLGKKSSVDPTDHPLLSFFVSTTAQLLGAERCSIFILDPATKRVWLKRGTGVEDRAIEVEIDGSVVGRVITSGQPVVDNDLSHKDGPHRQVANDTGFVTRNMVCVPLHATDGATLGAVQLLNKHQGDFTEADTAQLAELARYLQMTIETIYDNQELVSVVHWAARIGQMAAMAFAFLMLLLCGAIVLMGLYVIVPLMHRG